MKNFSVNEENIHYPSGSGNKLQIKLDSNTVIEELKVIENFPTIIFKFISLDHIQNVNLNERVDIMFKYCNCI